MTSTLQDAPETAEAHRVFADLKARGAPNAMDWNSGAGAAQLGWLRAELAAAAAAGERVIAAAHHPLVEGSAPAHYLAWNHEEIRAALEERPGLVPLVVRRRARGQQGVSRPPRLPFA